MRQVQAPFSQLQLNASVGPLPVPQPHGMVASVEHEGVSGAHAPYGSAMSMLGASPPGHAETPQAKEQVVDAGGVKFGGAGKTDIGP